MKGSEQANKYDTPREYARIRQVPRTLLRGHVVLTDLRGRAQTARKERQAQRTDLAGALQGKLIMKEA